MDLTADVVEPVEANREQESEECEDRCNFLMEQLNTSPRPHLQSDDRILDDGNLDKMPAEEEIPILVVTPETKKNSWLQEVSQAADDSAESVMSADSKYDSDGGSWTLEDGPEAQQRSDALQIEDMRRTIDLLNIRLTNAALESSSADEWHRGEVMGINRQHIENVEYQRKQWGIEHSSLLASKKKLADDHVHLQEQYDQAALQLQRQAQEIQDLDKERAVRSRTLSLMEGPGGRTVTYEERELELERLRGDAAVQRTALKRQIKNLETQMESEKRRYDKVIEQVHELRHHQNSLASNLANERSNSLRQKEQLISAQAYAADNFNAFSAEQENVRELVTKLSSEKESHEETKKTCQKTVDDMAKSVKSSVEYQSKLLRESFQEAHKRASDDNRARCSQLEEKNTRLIEEHRMICDRYVAKEKALADEIMMLAKKFNSRELVHSSQRREWQLRTDETKIESSKLLDANMALEQELKKERENVVDLLGSSKEDFKENIAILDGKDAVKDLNEQLEADSENGSFLDEKIEHDMPSFKRQLLDLNIRVNGAFQHIAWTMMSPSGSDDHAWTELKVHRVKQSLRGIDQRVDAMGRKITAQNGKPTRRELRNITLRLRGLKDDVGMAEQEVTSLREVIKLKGDPWHVNAETQRPRNAETQLPPSVREAQAEEAVLLKMKSEADLSTPSERETRNRALGDLLLWITEGKKSAEKAGRRAECIVLTPLEAKIKALMSCKKSDTAGTNDVEFQEIYTWRHLSGNAHLSSLELTPLYTIVNEVNAHSTYQPREKEVVKTSLNSLIVALANTVPHKTKPAEITKTQADLKTTFEYCLGSVNARGYTLRILATFRKEVLSRTQLRQWGVYDAILKWAFRAHAESKGDTHGRRSKPHSGLTIAAMCNEAESEAEPKVFGEMAKLYGNMRETLRTSMETRCTTCEELEPLVRFNREEFRFLMNRFLGGKVENRNGKDCRSCKSLGEMSKLIREGNALPAGEIGKTCPTDSLATGKDVAELPAEEDPATPRRIIACQKMRKVKKICDAKVVAVREMANAKQVQERELGLAKATAVATPVAAPSEAKSEALDASTPKDAPPAAPAPASPSSARSAAPPPQQPREPAPPTRASRLANPPAYEASAPCRSAAAHRERLARRAREWSRHAAAPTPRPVQRSPSPAESVISEPAAAAEAEVVPAKPQSPPTFSPPPSAPIPIPIPPGAARDEAHARAGIVCPAQYVPGQFPETYRFPTSPSF